MDSILTSEELLLTYERTLEALASIIESRNFESVTHIKRVEEFTWIMVEHLAQSYKYREQLEPMAVQSIVKAVALHDIGKIGISDQILLKPGKLNYDEFETIKTHTTIGSHIIGSIAKDIGGMNSYLKTAQEICRSHHERWDGKGYPDCLRGDEIPVSARILSVVDVYDALVSVRCYKSAYTHEQALDIMKQGRETQFDPDILDSFFSIEKKIQAVAF